MQVSLLGLCMAFFMFTWLSSYVGLCVHISLFDTQSSHTGLEPHPNDLILTNYICSDPVSKVQFHSAALGVRTSSQTFVEDTVQPIAVRFAVITCHQTVSEAVSTVCDNMGVCLVGVCPATRP